MAAAAGANATNAKLVLLGDMGAGKSSLVLRFVKGQFFDYQARARALPDRRSRRRQPRGACACV